MDYSRGIPIHFDISCMSERWVLVFRGWLYYASAFRSWVVNLKGLSRVFQIEGEWDVGYRTRLWAYAGTRE
jgi:hypothetical protein